MIERPKILIEQREYEELLEYKKKFMDSLNGDKYIHAEYVCGAGWGCVDYDTYWLLSKDDVVNNLDAKIKCLLRSYETMPLWRRIIRSKLNAGPYDVRREKKKQL